MATDAERARAPGDTASERDHAEHPEFVPRSIFTTDGERFVPTEQARGPWDPQALHGGAPAALIAAAFERLQPGAELRIGRLGFEFLRPIPMAPLTLATSVVRPGRRVQELAAELRAGEETIVRASALRVQAVAEDAEAAARAAAAGSDGRGAAQEDASADGDAGTRADAAMPPPAQGERRRFALNDSTEASFAGTAMEMRWLNDPWRPGPGRVWQRLRVPLVPDEELSSLTRLAATADFCNGVSATLPFDCFLFINADLTIHLQRLPRGEWIGLDARTRLHEGGPALAEGVLHDVHGPLGRAFQTLVVQPR